MNSLACHKISHTLNPMHTFQGVSPIEHNRTYSQVDTEWIVLLLTCAISSFYDNSVYRITKLRDW